jgi:hypothetical protein
VIFWRQDAAIIKSGLQIFVGSAGMRIEILVKGHLDKTWSDSLNDLSIRHLPEGNTVLAGYLRDQAALRGTICHLADLGLELISVFNHDALSDKTREADKM